VWCFGSQLLHFLFHPFSSVWLGHPGVPGLSAPTGTSATATSSSSSHLTASALGLAIDRTATLGADHDAAHTHPVLHRHCQQLQQRHSRGLFASSLEPWPAHLCRSSSSHVDPQQTVAPPAVSPEGRFGTTSATTPTTTPPERRPVCIATECSWLVVAAPHHAPPPQEQTPRGARHACWCRVS
jgi:hypothetical protein